MEVQLRGSKTHDVTLELIEKYPQKVTIRLDEILKERKMSQGDLHRLTGIRMATLNEISNGKKRSVNMLHFAAIMAALRITDIRELFNIEFNDEVQKAWEEEMKDYEGEGLTQKQKEELTHNVSRMYT
ncbi:XRE family transcriptional regulator [Oceanobacillus iheyensis]|nr:XRE family transcriptional regulator [Oceanobacillus iheyensis]